MAILSKITYKMKEHGGKCYLSTLYDELEPYCDRQSIRQCLNQYCSTSDDYRGAADIFCCLNDKARNGGIWGLKKRKTCTYRALINEYLILNNSATIEELYEYVQSFLQTNQSGKRYLREFIANKCIDTISFNYTTNTVTLKSSTKEFPLNEYFENLASNTHFYTYSFKLQKRTKSGLIALPEARAGEILERKILTEKINRLTTDIAKLRDNYTCQACGFNFRKLIVEPHILNPLIESEDEKTDSSNLITLCPNCHMLAHILIQYDTKYTDKKLLIEKIKELLAENKQV